MIKRFILAIVVIIMIVTTQGVGVNAAYNGTIAALYAVEHAQKSDYNTYYKSYSADCTNFVSQCIYAGGISQTDSSKKDFGTNNESSAWYHVKYKRWNTIFGIKYNERTDWKVSTTWVRVSDTGSGKGLYQYLTNTRANNVVIARSLEEVVKNAKSGDIIQCAKKGKTKSHSIIVTSVRNGDIGVSAHSNERCDVSFKSYFVPSYDTFYIIKVK